MPTPSPVPLISWLHLSDIHVGQGDAAHRWNQKQVMEDLLLDLRRLHELSAPRPELVFVTGDIAFKGDAAEYARSRDWLQQVLSILDLPPERLFLVPGNHDVNRKVDSADRDIKRLIKSVRDGADTIDTALDGGSDQVKLASRMAEFLRLAQDFAPWRGQSPMPDPAQRLWWQHRGKAASGQRLRIIGLNTALLAADDRDKGNLRLGQRQLAECFADPDADELVIVLSHHPFNEGWLHDQEDVSRRVGAKARLHLFGHIHGQELESSMRGSGHSLLRVCAGAVHPGQGEALPPSGHGYNLAALFPVPGDTEGRVELRIWPRRYSPTNQEFRDDVDNLPRGHHYACLPLNNFRSHVGR